MKNTLLALLGFILLSTPRAATAQQAGDFTYTLDNGGLTIRITRYTGLGGAVTIPAYIDVAPFQQKPVATIGNSAFQYITTLTSVTIPNSVSSIQDGLDYQGAFYECFGLTNITFLGGVTHIGINAFNSCRSLTSVTIPGTRHPGSIGSGAFEYCVSLTAVFFKGNAPSVGGNVFAGDGNATVYYLPGTTGWGATFAGAPTRMWNPLMQSSGPGFGVGPAGFGFNITGTADIPIVVEACTNLANASWVPLQSLNLTNGAFYYSDPDWTNYPARIYRIRSP